MPLMTDMDPELYSLVLSPAVSILLVPYCTAVLRKLHSHWRKQQQEIAVERC